VTGSNWVDLIVVVLVLLAAYSGFRQGVVASVLAFIGVMLGGAAAVLLAPHVLARVEDPVVRLLLGVGLLAGLVIIGQLSGMVLGRLGRAALRGRLLRGLDSSVGALLQAGAMLIAAWLLATPLSSASSPEVAKAVKGSAVMPAVKTAMDSFAPAFVRALPGRFAAVLDDSGLPEVLSPFVNTPVVPVSPPDPVTLGTPVVSSVVGRTVRIDGKAPNCGRALEGSGFVAAADEVVTNAHVVAGTSEVTVTAGGHQLPATVVLYNPQIDVAVLAVPGLGLSPLPMVKNGTVKGDSGFALGYPEGSRTVRIAPTRVRSKQVLEGPNMYRTGTVSREVYLLRGEVHPGNSGGPLFNAQGQVVGMIFGVATDDAETAFALTMAQVASAIDGQNLTGQVSTQNCVAG
jgi:S1-C subfamily serine protease